MGTALLALFVIAVTPVLVVSPVMAMTKEPYLAQVQFGTMGAPGKMWMADGILHLADVPDTATYTGTLGVGTMAVHFMHLTLNTETGQGTFIATWTITIGENTLSGSANGKITGGLTGTGTGYFRGTEGTGDFARIEKWGTFTINLATGVEYEEGTIIYH